MARSPLRHLITHGILALCVCQPAMLMAQQEPTPIEGEEPTPAQDDPQDDPPYTPAQDDEPDEEDDGTISEEDVEKLRNLKAQLKKKAEEEQEKEQVPLTPEEQVAQTFQVAQRLEQERLEKTRAQKLNAPVRSWYVEEDAIDPPQLEWGGASDCVRRESGGYLIMQCDHTARRCLVAESRVLTQGKNQASDELSPSNQVAAHTYGCVNDVQYSDMELLERQGYTLTPAIAEAPYGYKRDWRGRAFQTFFDLRSRAFIGVSYTGFFDGDAYQNSLSIETRSSYEHYSRYDGKRKRYRFLEGSLLVSPLRLKGQLFEYERARSGKEPLFFITEFIGEPSRRDVYMNIGRGFSLMRFDYRSMDRNLEELKPDDMGNAPGVKNQKFLDLAQGWLQWEIAQGLALEDYLGLRIGAGFGTRLEDGNGVYVYPEIGFRSAWLKSPRGLFSLSTEGRARYAAELGTGTQWMQATALASAEWVFLSISDQPISLFVEPQLDWLSYQGSQESLQEFKVSSGIRFSLFTPAPEDPATFEDQDQ